MSEEIIVTPFSEINSRFLRVFQDYPDARELVFYGGSGGGKSVSVAQILLTRFLDRSQPPTRMLFARKWLSALKNTLLIDCVRILQAWNVYGHIEHNKNESFMRFGTNRIDFLGLDNPEKIKGAEYNYIWLEEATDFDLEDVRQLRLRLGRNKANENAKYIFTFNPIDAQHWTWTDLVQTDRPGKIVRLSTYKDNLRNLSQDWINDLLALEHEDENYYRVYALGEPGILQNLIYSRYRITDFRIPVPDAIGIDFGYNNPTAVVGIKQFSDRLQVWEILYRSHMTNADLIDWLKAHRDVWNLRADIPIYADSAEPNRIEELRRAGYSARPADKSVKDGIDYCKAQTIEIHSSAVNLIREIRTYKYREDRSGMVYDEPVKFNDHALDSLRYVAYSHFGQRRAVSIPKEWLSFGGAR
jgi:phage terminase large subunit